jgi:molybdate transport system ATP-binding protein
MILGLERVSVVMPGLCLGIDAAFDSPVTGIWGPSGAGKTTLLELIAGLRRATAGRITYDGQVLSDAASRRHLPPRRRRIGYVPQDLALFPHLSVKANLAYGPRTSAGIEFDHVVEVLEIRSLLSRRVPELSGGEKQRVALGRALLSSPRLLLLDEPLASLDRALRGKILPALRRIRDEFRIPIIYVSHESFELESLCDELVCIENGLIAERRPVKRTRLSTDSPPGE